MRKQPKLSPGTDVYVESPTTIEVKVPPEVAPFGYLMSLHTYIEAPPDPYRHSTQEGHPA